MSEYNAFEKQKLFNTAFKSGDYRFLLYGGGVRSGKSYNQQIILLALALLHPKSRWVIIRKTLVNLKRTSFKTFQKICWDLGLVEGEDYRVNRQEMIVTFDNQSTFEFIDADVSKDPELNKLRGLEVDGALIEECNEVHEDVFNVLIQRVGQWLPEFKSKSFILLNCNPSQGWVKTKFYDKWKSDELKAPFYYQPALPVDNPHNTPEYLESLKELPPADYKTYVLGDWEAFVEPNQLIREEWLRACIAPVDYTPTKYRFLGVDVAREGDDKTVISYFDGVCIYKLETFSGLDNYAVATKVWEAIKKEGIDPDNVWIDTVGLGAGVYDILKKNGFKCKQFKAGEGSKTKHDFYDFANAKAELNYFFMENIRKGKIKIVNDKELINELLQIRYKSDERVFAIEKKAEYKKRIGKSPDKADSAMMSICSFLYRKKGFVI